MTMTDDRPISTCPSWCAEYQPDVGSPAINHWSAITVLPGGNQGDLHLEPAAIAAHVSWEAGDEPLAAPVLVITGAPEHVRSADQARAFAEVILAFVDTSREHRSSTTAGSQRPSTGTSRSTADRARRRNAESDRAAGWSGSPFDLLRFLMTPASAASSPARAGDAPSLHAVSAG